MEKIVSRLIKWAKGESAPPKRVLIYPTNNCNLKCPFCYQRLNPYDKSKDLKHERWLEITEELCKMGTDVIQISGGGEPLMVPNTTLKMMEIIKDYNVTGRLVNNGTLWKNEDIKKTIKMGWDRVIFSVDGPNPEINDKSRGVKGTFKKIVKNIKLFNKYKEKLYSEKPLLEFSTVVSRFNYSSLGKIIKLAHNLKISNVTFEPVFVSNPSVRKLKVSSKERDYISKKIPDWKKLATSLSVNTNLEMLFNVKEIEKTGQLKDKILEISKPEFKHPFIKAACFEPWIWPKIEADGRVGPCSTIFLSDFYEGEVSVRNKSFEDVWLGKEFKDFRKKMLIGDLPEACENCVSTHLDWNAKIRRKLKKGLK